MDTAQLILDEAIWARLCAFLGEGAGGKPNADEETEHAIRDHNKIRSAVMAVARHAVGTPGWFAAVAAANKENGDHMAEEEREGLPTSGATPIAIRAIASPSHSPPSKRATSRA